MRRKYEARLRAVGEPAGASGPADDEHAQLAAIQQSVQEAQRRTLHDLRARGTIGDDAFHRVEQELDWGSRATRGPGGWATRSRASTPI
jgi:monovalent cation/hydrogen antiporter